MSETERLKLQKGVRVVLRYHAVNIINIGSISPKT